MAFSEDLTVFFDTEDFADNATYTRNFYPHPSAETTTISGVFNDDFVEFDGVMSSSPVFICAASDVNADPQDDYLTHAGTEYRIREFNPDGSGLILLILEAA